MAQLRWPGAPIDLQTVGWLELQLLLADDAWETGIQLAQQDAVRSVERLSPAGICCVVEDQQQAHDVTLNTDGADCSCDDPQLCADGKVFMAEDALPENCGSAGLTG